MGKTIVKIKDSWDENFGKTGFIEQGSHNDWEVHFADGTKKWYHSMSLEAIPVEPKNKPL